MSPGASSSAYYHQDEVWEDASQFREEEQEAAWQEVGAKARAKKAKQQAEAAVKVATDSSSTASSKAEGKKPMRDGAERFFGGGDDGAMSSSSRGAKQPAAAAAAPAAPAAAPAGRPGSSHAGGMSDARNGGASSALGSAKKGKGKSAATPANGVAAASAAAAPMAAAAAAASLSSGGGGSGGKKQAAPTPKTPPPPAASSDAATAAPKATGKLPASPAKKGGGKRELSKPELQARCEAIVAAEGGDAGWVAIPALEQALCASLEGVTSWESKYKQAHGALRTFLQRCPNLSVAALDAEERVYLSRMLDAPARAAIAAEKAERLRLTSPAAKRRKSAPRGKQGWPASLLRLVPRSMLLLACGRMAGCALGWPYLGCHDPTSSCDSSSSAPLAARFSFACVRAAGGASELQEQCLRAWLPPLLDLHDTVSAWFGPSLGRAIPAVPGCSPPTHTLLRWVGGLLLVVCALLLLLPRSGSFACAAFFALHVNALCYTGVSLSLFTGGLAALSALAALQAAFSL